MENLTSALIKKKARENLAGSWYILILFYIIGTVFANLSLELSVGFNLFISILFSIMLVVVALDVFNNNSQAMSFMESMKRVGKDKGINSMIVLGFYMTLLLIFWFLLLIIPGIYKSYEYSQAYFILNESNKLGKPKSYNQCLKESKVMMKGNKGRLFMQHLSFIAWVIVVSLLGEVALRFVDNILTEGSLLANISGSVVFGLLNGPVASYILMSNIVFYETLKSNQNVTVQTVDNLII